MAKSAKANSMKIAEEVSRESSPPNLRQIAELAKSTKCIRALLYFKALESFM